MVSGNNTYVCPEYGKDGQQFSESSSLRVKLPDGRRDGKQGEIPYLPGTSLPSLQMVSGTVPAYFKWPNKQNQQGSHVSTCKYHVNKQRSCTTLNSKKEVRSDIKTNSNLLHCKITHLE